MDYGAWELGEYSAGPPVVYHLQLPSGFHLRRLARRAVRKLRRKTEVQFEELMRRPLNEETGFTPIRQTLPDDRKYVLAALEENFRPENLVVTNLQLTFHKHVKPGFPYDPYDLVKVRFTVQKAQA